MPYLKALDARDRTEDVLIVLPVIVDRNEQRNHSALDRLRVGLMPCLLINNGFII